MHPPFLVVAAFAVFLHSTTAYPMLSMCIGKLRINCPPADPPVDSNPTKTYGDHLGSTSIYPDGSGTLVSIDDRHKWDNGDECWTDLFYVSSSDKKTKWERKAINHCNGNSTDCRMTLSEGVETCNRWSLNVEAGLAVPLVKKLFEISASVTVAEEWSRCDSLKTESYCTWDDKKCHTIYARMSQRTDLGYIRRRCNFQGAGDKTYWSKDWNITEKGTVPELGCEASCDATTYPEP